MKYVLMVLVMMAVLGVSVVLWPKETNGPVVTPEVTENIATPMVPAEPSVVASDVQYFENATGFYARPSGEGVYPGVVMIHENRGLRPEIKEAAKELAAAGYRVLAVDLYKGTVMETQEEARAYSAQYNREEGVANMRAATAFLRTEGAPKVASLGWCFGGAESLALSLSGEPIDATVIYYGRLATTTEALGALKSPVLGIFGDQDQVVPTSSVATFEAALAELKIPAEIHMYKGVGHAFANPSNPNHAPAETTDAWEKTLAFLARTIRD